MGENNLYIHNVDLVDPVDLDPQFYFASEISFITESSKVNSIIGVPPTIKNVFCFSNLPTLVFYPLSAAA